MPALRPPRLTANASPVELKRAAQQIARSQRLTVSPPLTLQESSSGFHFGVDTSREFFLARLTNVYTPTGGSLANINLYSFIEQIPDPTTGIPTDFANGRQTYPALTGTPTSAYAIEANNTLLTVPGTTPSGYSHPGPYVEMRLKNVTYGIPVYEFLYTPGSSSISYLTSTASNASLTTSYTNVGLSVTIPSGSTWLATAQLNGSITSSSSSSSDSLSFRYYNGTAAVGNPIECCYAVCASLTFVDAAPLVAVVVNSTGSSFTLTVQGAVNTSTGSTGLFLGATSYLAAIRLA